MNSTTLPEAALAVLLEAHWAAKALRSQKRQQDIAKATKAIAGVFKRQGGELLEQLSKLSIYFLRREASYEMDMADAFMETFNVTRRQAEKVMFEVMFEGIVGGYESLSGEFGLEAAFKINPNLAKKWAAENAATKVTQINQTTEKTIRNIIVKGINEGKGYGETAREIKTRFSEFAEGRPQQHIRSRAELVAVQENAMAYENGQAILVGEIEDVGVEMEKQITGPMDELTSEICAAAMDMGWVSTDTAFPGGEMTAPLHVACRHSTIYRVKE
jgi:hypothetical protein